MHATAGPAIRPFTAAVVPAALRLAPLPARAPEPTENPGTPAKIALGRLLFFDPILSGAGDVACATCHHPRFGWGDGRATPIGFGGTGLGPERVFRAPAALPAIRRNAPTLLNVGFNGVLATAATDPGAAPMFWDSRVRGLEAQIAGPLQAREEMRGDAGPEDQALAQAVDRVQSIAEYRRMFGEAFAAPPAAAVTVRHLTQAIAAFERTLVTAGSPIDRFLRGNERALTPEQQRGLGIFQEAGCIQCHGGPMFSDFQVHFIGGPEAAPGDARAFRTPTLRNLRVTAPYMHNGRLRTVRDVLAFYEELSEAVSETLDGGDAETQPRLDPLLRQLNLREQDFPALEAFLDALNDDKYHETAPARVPSGLPVPQ